MKNFGNPKFITFEGGEGSGKSTQSKMLYEYLLSQDIKAIHTREVGGTKEAEEIRQLLINRDLYSVSELMLVMAARYEHINKRIVPALRSGYSVICDRFVDSTACYQANETITIEDIFSLHNKLMTAHDDFRTIMPDITFFMDLEPKIGIKRSIEAGDTNKFEDKNMNFHQKVYERFKTIASTHSNRVKSVNCEGRGSLEVHQAVLSLLIANQFHSD